MRVLMFGWEFPPHISGGLGTACYGLTKAMSKIPDIDILFVVPKAYGDEDRSAANVIGAADILVDQQQLKLKGFQKEINFIKVESALVPYTTEEEYFRLMAQMKEKQAQVYAAHNFKGKLHFTGKYGANLYEEINNYAMVAAMIALQYEFDIIHAHDWLTYPAGIAAKQISGKPLVVHVHATDFDRSGGNVNPYVYEVEKNGMMMADKVITVSNYTRDIVINKYGIDPAKVITVHNAVEPVYRENGNTKPYRDKIVTFLGRITLQKGPDYFIQAARKVLKRMKNVRFVMAGSGDMLNRMISHVARAGIADRFHFTGFLSGDDVYKMFEMSDVYVMPSISEPFGIAPLEAIQSNVPVIISKQSGVAEVLNYAVKIDFWDVDAMADAIYALLNYDALSVTFKKYGKEEVQALQWEKTASRIYQIYSETVKK